METTFRAKVLFVSDVDIAIETTPIFYRLQNLKQVSTLRSVIFMTRDI